MRLIILFVAIAFAAGAFFLTLHFTSKPPEAAPMPVMVEQNPAAPAPTPTVETVDVYTAKDDMPIGTIISPEMLDIRPWPKSQVQEDMVVSDAAHPITSMSKMIVRTPFQKGEPIYHSKLANENDPSFLASSLGQGMRLITVAVDAISGGGGFVFPGDFVDVLVTHDVIIGYSRSDSGSNNLTGTGTPETIQPEKKSVTEVLIPNVRVMATNQKSTAHGGEPPVVPANISLEVSTEDAQKIRLVENGNGHLSLALRALKDKNSTSVPRPSDMSDLSAVKAVANPDAAQVEVVRGTSVRSVEVDKP